MLDDDIPDDSVQPGEKACCLADDHGAECEDRTPDECQAEGGKVGDATSCMPNPCATAPGGDEEVGCCVARLLSRYPGVRVTLVDVDTGRADVASALGVAQLCVAILALLPGAQDRTFLPFATPSRRSTRLLVDQGFAAAQPP